MSKKCAPIYITDRSAADLDDKCSMAYWWNREEAEKGIVLADEALALRIGRAIHEDLAALAVMEDLSPAALQATIDRVLAPLTEDDRKIQHRMEILYRRLGWVAAWGLYMEPIIRQHWENVFVEGELVLDRTPLWVAVTPDRILRSKLYGFYKYIEYKSTASTSKKWLDHWRHAIQLHIGLKAVSEELGVPVKYAEVVGLVKGYTTYGEQARLAHPYAWGYYHADSQKWTAKYEDARSKGWEAMPVWEYPGGIVAWVQLCGEEIARAQFPHTAPVFLDDRMLTSWVEHQIVRQRQISAVRTRCQVDLKTRAVFFPRRFGQCRPPFGEACPYLRCCWNATTEVNPLEDPEYIPRIPHHTVEAVNL